jgi:hypothetical protein
VISNLPWCCLDTTSPNFIVKKSSLMFLQCLHQSGARHPGSLRVAAMLAIAVQGCPAGTPCKGARQARCARVPGRHAVQGCPASTACKGARQARCARVPGKHGVQGCPAGTACKGARQARRARVPGRHGVQGYPAGTRGDGEHRRYRQRGRRQADQGARTSGMTHGHE